MDDELHNYRSQSVAFKIAKNMLRPVPTELPSKSSDLKLPEIKRKPATFIDKPPIPRSLKGYISQKSDRHHLSSMKSHRERSSEPQEPSASFTRSQESFQSSTVESFPEELKENKMLIPQQEIKELRIGLKRKWKAIRKELKSLESNMDEDAIKLKQLYHQELEQLQRDMHLLDKDYVFVDTSN